MTNGDDDTVSLFVFGEEENSLAAEAQKNNGIVPHERVANHHFPPSVLAEQKQKKEAIYEGVNGTSQPAVRSGLSGKEKEGSSTCMLM